MISGLADIAGDMAGGGGNGGAIADYNTAAPDCGDCFYPDALGVALPVRS